MITLYSLSINLQRFNFALEINHKPPSIAVTTCSGQAPLTNPVVSPNVILSTLIYFSQATKCFLKYSACISLYSSFLTESLPPHQLPELLLEITLGKFALSFKTCSLSNSYCLPRVSPLSECHFINTDITLQSLYMTSPLLSYTQKQKLCLARCRYLE